MMRKLLLILMFSPLVACVSTQDLGKGKTGKSIIVSGNSYDQVWQAALESVRQTTGDQKLEVEKSLHVTKEDKAAGEILANTSISLWSWGEVVGVYIDPPRDAAQHKIEVESRAKLQTNIVANNWEDEILQGIQTRLKK